MQQGPTPGQRLHPGELESPRFAWFWRKLSGESLSPDLASCRIVTKTAVWVAQKETNIQGNLRKGGCSELTVRAEPVAAQSRTDRFSLGWRASRPPHLALLFGLESTLYLTLPFGLESTPHLALLFVWGFCLYLPVVMRSPPQDALLWKETGPVHRPFFQPLQKIQFT